MAGFAAIARPLAWLPMLVAFAAVGCADLDRKLFENNRRFARTFLRPMAKHYKKTVPEPLRKGLRNVTSNVTYPEVMVNNLLQGKPDRAFTDLGRIAVNTVVGFGGIFDPATDIGIPSYEEDFGQTLGVWGFEPGPYFNAPFVGPTTLRDVMRYPFALATSPFTYVDAQALSLPLGVSNYFFERFEDVEQLDIVEEAVDPYAFVKDAYLQHRESLVHDGDPPANLDEGLDEELDEALEGLEDLEDLEDLEEFDDLEDMDALDGLGDLEELAPQDGEADSEGGLPAPVVVRRAGAAPHAAPPPAPAPLAPRRGALPPPVVRSHGAVVK